METDSGRVRLDRARKRSRHVVQVGRSLVPSSQASPNLVSIRSRFFWSHDHVAVGFRKDGTFLGSTVVTRTYDSLRSPRTVPHFYMKVDLGSGQEYSLPARVDRRWIRWFLVFVFIAYAFTDDLNYVNAPGPFLRGRGEMAGQWF